MNSLIREVIVRICRVNLRSRSKAKNKSKRECEMLEDVHENELVEANTGVCETTIT